MALWFRLARLSLRTFVCLCVRAYVLVEGFQTGLPSTSSCKKYLFGEINAVFGLPNPNLDSDWIQWNRPFSARIWIRIRESSESSFGADSLAKPEVLSSTMTSRRHHRSKRTTMTSSHWTTLTNPGHSICQRIRIQIHCKTESIFGQIEYGLRFSLTERFQLVG